MAVQPFVNLSESSKFQIIQLSKSLFEEMKCVAHRPLLQSSQQKLKLEIISEISMDNPLCGVVNTTYMKDPQRS